MQDKRLKDLLNYIAKTSFEMLAAQGFDMAHMQTDVSEFWGQEFSRGGGHIEHVHGRGVQITGFYFVDVPDNSSHPTLSDPRPGKRQINLGEADRSKATYASDHVLFDVKAGDLMMFNSWMPHGFTPNPSESPFRFIHFNVSVYPKQQCCVPSAEVV